MRGPSDLRVIQQGLRSGIISTLSAAGQENYLHLLLERQILSSFHIHEVICANWQRIGLTGAKHLFHLPIPSFRERNFSHTQ